MKSELFEWDVAKNHINQKRHGISFECAQQAFLDPKRVIARDDKHSQKEKRFYCFGRVGNEVLTVRYTMRGKKIRIIGAGYWRKGRKTYEKRNSI